MKILKIILLNYSPYFFFRKKSNKKTRAKINSPCDHFFCFSSALYTGVSHLVLCKNPTVFIFKFQSKGQDFPYYTFWKHIYNVPAGYNFITKGAWLY